MRFHIGLDLMGSNIPILEMFESVAQLSNSIDETHKFFLIGTPAVLDSLKSRPSNDSISFVEASDEITMDDAPLLAIRRKKDSSIVKGMHLLKSGAIDAFVSSGNTGALVASARINLSTFPQIDRPALLVCLPTKTSFVAVLDVGANVDIKVDSLVQFAKMGAIFQQNANNIDVSKVGLLNIGTEAQKGTKNIREAYEALLEASKSMNIDFLGNIEGHEVFEGKADVLITDGFTGNVFLKTTEGISLFILTYLEQMFDRKTGVVGDMLKKLSSQVNYAEYPGAVLCGVEGLVIKCHGYSSPKAIVNGLRGAFHYLKKGLIDDFRSNL